MVVHIAEEMHSTPLRPVGRAPGARKEQGTCCKQDPPRHARRVPHVYTACREQPS